jgi:hypothetical protein
MISRQYWKQFLMQTHSGLVYYKDAAYMTQLGNVLSGIDYSLPQMAQGWEDTQLSFGRNTHYWGINRSYTIPLKFVGDGAAIIRELFYGGIGIETPLTLVVLKWDDINGFFGLYYRGQIDLTKINDEVADGVTVNIMEGGVIQLLKAYENTVIEIPCDGSIPENIKVNCDGILFNDVFHYQIIPVQPPIAGDIPLPAVFLSNDGDNIGIIHNDPIIEAPYTGYYQKSGNFILTSIAPIKVRIQGTITVRSDWRVHNTSFYMHTATSFSQPRAGGADHQKGLIKPFSDTSVDPSGIWQPVDSQVHIDGQQVYNFDETVSLSANENLFILFFNNFEANPINILGGSLSLTFQSRYQSSRVWGVTFYDLFRLLMREICALASTAFQTFNYQADSKLLQQYLRLVITSGDAARASTDPNYGQYFNQVTINPQNPNNQFYNQFPSLGPTIKTTLSNCFDTANAILNAALSNQTLPGEQESLFIERKSYVMDSSVVTMTLPQVSNLRISLDLEHFFNWLEIGYEPQQYDEKSGKFEYNNTNRYQAPIKSLAKVLQLISKYRADSYGFEFTRYNTQGGKSSTFNSSDNSVFILNTDFTSFIFDYFSAVFTSSITSPSSPTNTDQHLILNQNYQPFTFGTLNGEYFTNNLDFSIFMFTQPAPGLKTVVVAFTCLLNGLIGDSATIKMYINGVVVQTWSQAITGVNTTFNNGASFSHTFAQSDNIYFTISTVLTCTAQISTFSLNVGSGYFICNSSGNIDISAGSTQQMISLPTQTPTLVVVHGTNVPVMQSGYEYFMFLSNVGNKNFDWSFQITGYVNGLPSETTTFDVWKNGVNVGTVTYPGVNTITAFNPTDAIVFSGNFNFNLYDIIWVTASATNVNVWVVNAELLFTSTGIKAYNLLRKAYDAVSGIQNPETAFNIEDLTPARMLQANYSLLKSILFNLPGMLKFQTTDKNQFISTTSGGVTITENASIDPHAMGDALFIPLIAEFDTEVPDNFAALMNQAVNAHIQFPYRNKNLFVFPDMVSVKPALREKQSWKCRISPKTNILDLIDLDWDGIITLQLMDAMIPFICPVHFVPLAYTKDPRYNTYTMDQDWFKNRITDWIDTNDYFAPWQTNDTIQLQCQTAGLSPVTAQIVDCNGRNVGAAINIPSVANPAILAPQALYQGSIPLNTVAEGKYYILYTMGVGGAMASFISEGIWVKAYWPKTQLVEYSNTRNKLAVVFTSGYKPSIRMMSQISRFTPKSKSSVYIDEPQDITLLNAIPYDTWKWTIGFDSGIPDYMMRKIDRIMLLDTTSIDGDQYSRDGEANVEKQSFPGQPKEYLTLDIRKALNEDGITLNTSGQIDSQQQAGYVMDANAVGQNAGQNLINVTSV